MGGFASSVQSPQTSGGGKGSSSPQPIQTNWSPQPLDGVSPGYQPKPMGKGGAQTNSATSGQPRVGVANQYSNTVGVGDNTDTSTQPSATAGKAKGA